jgi:hypothetical protein
VSEGSPYSRIELERSLPRQRANCTRNTARSVTRLLRWTRTVFAALVLAPAVIGAQEPEPRPPVQLPPSTTMAEARRAETSHNYWRGVDATTGCPRGLTREECGFLSRAIAQLLEHEDPFCRTAGQKVSERIAEGRVIVPAVDGPSTGPRVGRGDIILPANWVSRPVLILVLVSQVSREGMDAGVRCADEMPPGV